MSTRKRTPAAKVVKIRHGHSVGTPKMASLGAASTSTASSPAWAGPLRGEGQRRARAQGTPVRAVGEARSRSLARLRADVGVSRRIFARLLASSERALADWEAGRDPGEMATGRINEVRRLVAALAGVMEKGFVGTWLQEPNEAFSGLKPLEVIERGEIDRIWRMLFYLESGVPG